MTAKEYQSDQEVGNEESTLLQLDPYEEEETLSLCDLPIYSGSVSAKWGGGNNFSKEDGKNIGEDDDNLFEFFSEEFTASSNATADNIIFCGKLIPFKDIPPRVESKVQQKGSATNKAKRWKSYSSSSSSSMRCSTKSRWFLFMFGMSKVASTEMELRDIRNRQSRRRGSAWMFAAAEDEKGKRSCKGRMWKMFKSMSLVLGCRSSKIANHVAKAAFL